MHPVPRDLKGEARIIQIPYLDLYLNKRGCIYNGAVTLLSGLILKLTSNVILFFTLAILLNIAVYPLAQCTTKKNAFDGGNIRLDNYFMMKLRYRKRKNVYLRQTSGYK